MCELKAEKTRTMGRSNNNATKNATSGAYFAYELLYGRWKTFVPIVRVFNFLS